MVKVKGTSFEFILDMYDVDDQNRVQIWRVNSKWFKGYHIHRQLHKYFNFHDKFTLMVKVKVTSFKLVQKDQWTICVKKVKLQNGQFKSLKLIFCKFKS